MKHLSSIAKPDDLADGIYIGINLALSNPTRAREWAHQVEALHRLDEVRLRGLRRQIQRRRLADFRQRMTSRHARRVHLAFAERVIDHTAAMYLVSRQEIESSRRKDAAEARQVASYIIRESVDMTLASIGELFGGKDHSTISWHVDRTATRLQVDRDLRMVVDEITAACVPTTETARRMLRTPLVDEPGSLVLTSVV